MGLLRRPTPSNRLVPRLSVIRRSLCLCSLCGLSGSGSAWTPSAKAAR